MERRRWKWRRRRRWRWLRRLLSCLTHVFCKRLKTHHIPQPQLIVPLCYAHTNVVLVYGEQTFSSQSLFAKTSPNGKGDTGTPSSNERLLAYTIKRKTQTRGRGGCRPHRMRDPNQQVYPQRQHLGPSLRIRLGIPVGSSFPLNRHSLTSSGLDTCRIAVRSASKFRMSVTRNASTSACEQRTEYEDKLSFGY